MPIELLKMKIMLLFFIFWNIQSGKAIYGGKEVIPNQYPWVLILRFYRFHNEQEMGCGASLISNKYALTAAHCVSQPKHGSIKNMEIIAGEHSLIENENSEKRIKICKINIHPLFQYGHHTHVCNKCTDLAILEFCNPIEFNDHIQPIELAPPKLNIWKYGRPNVTTAGWGRMENNEKSYELRALTHQITTEKIRNVCEHLMVPYSLKGWWSVTKTFILTFDDYSSINSGDSGGPLWWKDAETHKIYQVGVTKGIDFEKKQIISSYSAVNENYQWIMDNTN